MHNLEMCFFWGVVFYQLRVTFHWWLGTYQSLCAKHLIVALHIFKVRLWIFYFSCCIWIVARAMVGFKAPH